MSFEPISGTLLNQIHRESLKESEKRRESGYWIECPSCGKQVVKKELLKKGCYVCGWKGTEEEHKLVQAKQLSEASSTIDRKKNTNPYWINCPKCGRRVVREQFEEKGCFICGEKQIKNDRKKEGRKR